MADYTFVKMSDAVMTAEDLIGATCVLHTVSAPDEDMPLVITEDMIEDGTTMGYPALLVGEFIVAAQADFSIYGLYVEKGVYFLHYSEDNVTVGYVKSLSALPNEVEVTHKLDNKYLDAEWMANYINGSEEILGEAVQPFSGSTRKTAQQVFQFTLEAGKTYEVSWDDEIYLCTAGEIREDYYAVAYLGNPYMLDDEYPDTGEPFAIACLTIMGMVLLTQIGTTEQEDSHRIGIKQVGMIRNRIPFQFMPKRYVFPSDFSHTGVVDDELEKAYLHMLNGGEVYANYANSPYKVLMIDFDLWDGMFHSLVMTDGEDIMMWGKEQGWVRHTRNSFMLVGNDGNKYRIYVDSNGKLATSQTTYI